MAFASLFTLPDDITAVLDDVALMTKPPQENRRGRRRFAFNANRVGRIGRTRIAGVWSLAKVLSQQVGFGACGPAAFHALPQLITPLLTAGGIYLCFEGVKAATAVSAPT